MFQLNDLEISKELQKIQNGINRLLDEIKRKNDEIDKLKSSRALEVAESTINGKKADTKTLDKIRNLSLEIEDLQSGLLVLNQKKIRELKNCFALENQRNSESLKKNRTELVDKEKEYDELAKKLDELKTVIYRLKIKSDKFLPERRCIGQTVTGTPEELRELVKNSRCVINPSELANILPEIELKLSEEPENLSSVEGSHKYIPATQAEIRYDDNGHIENWRIIEGMWRFTVG